LQDFRSKANAGSQPFVSYDMLKKTIVKIPNISMQNKIADTLDKFYLLLNDISIGLPAELKARRQQYEYYRNKLITFKEYVG
jgi:type I restriction enzyme S subunit